MLNEVYFLNVRLGKHSTNCNGGCKTENATYKTILEEVKGNEGRKDEVILIEIKRECINNHVIISTFAWLLSRN